MNGWYPQQIVDRDGKVRCVSGAGELWLDGKDTGVAGNEPRWWSDHEVLYNGGPVHGDEGGLRILDLTNGEDRQIHSPEVVGLACGAGQWAAYDGHGSVVCSDGTVYSDAYQVAMAPDGTRLVRHGDAFIDPSIGLQSQAVVLLSGGGRRVQWTARGSSQSVTLPGEMGPCVIDTPSGPWLLSLTNTTLRLRAFDAPDVGYEWDLGENNNLHPNGVYVGGKIAVACCTAHGGLTRLMADLSAPRKPFAGAVTPEPAPPVSAAAVPALKAHPRKLWIAPFYSFSERYGDTPKDDYQRYANAITLVEDQVDPSTLAAELARIYPLGLPLIVQGDGATNCDKYVGNIVAWWTSGATLLKLEAAVGRAATRDEKPIVAYLDRGDVTDWPASRPAWVSGRVWPSVQAYRRAGETLTSFRARVEGMLTRIAGYGDDVYCALTPRFDDADLDATAYSVAQTVECMPLYHEWIARYRICCVMPFADRRGRGIAADAQLRAWAEAFELANVARPSRFDYWTPAKSDTAAVLRNKLGQSTEVLVLSPQEKQFLLGKLAG